MVLAVLAGWALQRFAGVEGAMLPALLLGMLIALMVPARAVCATRSEKRSTGSDAS